MIRSSDGGAESPWSPREAELLAVTLELLQEHGYDRLTVDAVATTARASKATIYRRWPTKAELVMAAFVEGTRQVAVDPDTGTLRGDLLRLGESICAHVSTHASTIRAVLVEVSRSAELDAMMQEQFLDQRKALMTHVLARGRRPRRDRRLHHHRGPLGRVARLPHLPLGPQRPSPITPYHARPRRQRAHPQPHPSQRPEVMSIQRTPVRLVGSGPVPYRQPG